VNRTRILVSLLGFSVGAGVFAWWLQLYGSTLGVDGGVDWRWLGASFLFMCLAPCVQVMRTSAIFERDYSEFARLVFSCHGVNAVLPALGDVAEIGWLTKLTGLQVREVLARGLIRMLFTFGVTVAVVGAVTGLWVLTLVGVLGPVVVLGTSDSWWRWAQLRPGDGGWRRVRSVPLHFGLALLQLGVEACAFICVAWSLSLPVNFSLAIGLRSVVEWTTYFPVPLSGLGLHHAGITEFAEFVDGESLGLASHAVLHHGLFLLSALAVGLTAWFVLLDKKMGR
jgi:hypothetical protein